MYTRRLYLIRHAKSDWEQAATDFERPLNARGLRNAPLMGGVLHAQGLLPDLIVSSPAVRALHTAQLLAAALDYDIAAIRQEPRIYEAPTAHLQQVVSELPDAATCVCMFGHNPGFTRLANLLCTDLLLDNLPTCGVVGLAFEASRWQDVATHSGKLLLLDYPKRHAE